MKRWLVCATLSLAACGIAPPGELPEDLAGHWDVQEVAGASLGQGVDIWMAIDASTGEITGYTGCHAFTASAEMFGSVISIGGVSQAEGACESPEAEVDQQRFLGVLPHVQRYIRNGRSLELLQSAPGSEALLRLRLELPNEH